MQKSKKRILFIGDCARFIDTLKNEGYDVKATFSGSHLNTIIWLEKPDFIIQYIDNLEFNGIDPMKYIPRQFISRTLTVSTIISPKDLVQIMRQQKQKNALGEIS